MLALVFSQSFGMILGLRIFFLKLVSLGFFLSLIRRITPSKTLVSGSVRHGFRILSGKDLACFSVSMFLYMIFFIYLGILSIPPNMISDGGAIQKMVPVWWHPRNLFFSLVSSIQIIRSLRLSRLFLVSGVVGSPLKCQFSLGNSCRIRFILERI